MIRILLALLMALAPTAPSAAKPRHAHRAVCVPITIEGVGTVRVCPLR